MASHRARVQVECNRLLELCAQHLSVQPNPSKRFLVWYIEWARKQWVLRVGLAVGTFCCRIRIAEKCLLPVAKLRGQVKALLQIPEANMLCLGLIRWIAHLIL